VLATISVLALWAVGYVLAISPIEHARAQHELYATFRGQLANANAALHEPIAQGTPVALLRIPGAGIGDEMVVEGTTAGDLRFGPGHLPSTPLPGEAGVSVVYGRSLTFGAPFRHIASLTAGELITVTTDQGVFHYAVTDVRRPGDPVPSQLSAGQGRLVLVTSAGGDWQSGWVPHTVVYVDATLKGTAAPDPGGRPSAVSPAQAPLAGQDDSLTLVAIILWLQLLCVVIVATAWLRSRWQRRQVWFVGGGVLVAVLWALSHTAVVLLPNLV
jgi:sortase A